MLAVARIPLGPGAFAGIVGVVLLGGKEYRVATCLGARLVSMRDGKILVRQRGLELQAVRMEDAARPLRAPTREGMTRLIRENVSCRTAYSLKKDGRTLWELEVPNAAFEYEYPQ